MGGGLFLVVPWWYLVCEDPGSFEALFERAWRERKPLLARQCVDVGWWRDDWADEIAGLTFEDDVCARIYVDASLRDKTLLDDLDLPPTNWTILVNDMERLHPEIGRRVASLWPRRARWARDDAMVSIAAEGGGVGPHVDSSDVVLLQTNGRRRWSLDRVPVADDAFEFGADATFDLDAGDLLYVPARLPHDGVSLSSDCATLSLGFRSWSAADVATRWIENHAFFDDDEDDREKTKNIFAGLLGDDHLPEVVLETAKREILGLVERKLDATIAECLGEIFTEPRDASLNNDDRCWDRLLADRLFDAELLDAATTPPPPPPNGQLRWLVHRAAGARFAWTQRDDRTILLFTDGLSTTLPPDLKPLALLLADPTPRLLDLSPFLPEATNLLTTLLERRHLIALDDDDDDPGTDASAPSMMYRD
ncbi:hypothetical protein CTAYLR_008516 [Chrysophaeum taylorii]|uniref:JmjC domain-containing protein n=1 Tax=Chrysophaeum taylorii TaxID=2483200 RepID=A0AAD7U9N5_9STRA|nr:hypothetical protein CTAYLR_008516 [Chrysophaeum taylorii]